MDMEKLLEKIKEKIPYARLAGIDIRTRWGVVGAVPLLVLALLFFLLISPRMADTERLNGELVSARQDVQKKRTLERRLPEFENEIKVKDYELSLLRRQLPEEKEIPDLIDQVSNLGTQSGLEFLTFKPLADTEMDFYAEVPVELKIVGSFHNLVAFFDSISRLPRIVTIKNLSIEKNQATGKKERGGKHVVMATCMAITYRFIEAKVDAPAKGNDKKKQG